MGDIQLLDILDPTQTSDLAVDAVESTGSLELAQPGIGILTGHIVVGVIAGNHHQRAQNDLGVARSLNSLDDVLAGSLFRLALNGANEHIVVAQSLHSVCIWL